MKFTSVTIKRKPASQSRSLANKMISNYLIYRLLYPVGLKFHSAEGKYYLVDHLDFSPMGQAIIHWTQNVHGLYKVLYPMQQSRKKINILNIHMLYYKLNSL